MSIATSRCCAARMRGVTLLELMLVVLLLGVLAAVALPSYGKYRNRVRMAQAVSDITVMSAALALYERDNRAFPDSLAEIGNAGKLDPWGRAYVYYNVDKYGRGHARKDRALNPINTDFDLYSVGPDGRTHKQVSNRDSLDDLIRANNGRFLGVAADF